MTTRQRSFDRATDRARQQFTDFVRELRTARVDRGLSLDDVGRAVGLSPAQVSRIERALVPSVSVLQLARLSSAVGLDLTVRAYPGGEAIRDAAHAALLDRFRAKLHRSLAWRTEVPLPIPGDPRAWDATIRGTGWILGIEAETRPRDLQALERRIALKRRDGGVDRVVLLLGDSRHNRSLLRDHADALLVHFPVPGRRALELLGAGVDPGGSAVVLL